ncbi:hypothetical protein HDU87_006967 [Geranomyces variabilis]|uniref:Uncharacterized protein n=1 Tax=Geranomyces variabilis TaxID=109894 RepID=A0AAD5TFF7_9FUNG|nr:hypothetical protein HDU87_006967 [Geranomyces variabilis]
MKTKVVAAPHSLATKVPPKTSVARKQAALKPTPTATGTTECKPAEPNVMVVLAPDRPTVAANIEEDLPPPPLDRSLRSMDIRNLVEVLKPIVEHPVRTYTPLILDRSRRVETFFRYSADFDGIFLPAKKFLLKTLVQKTMTLPEALEEMRTLLVTAMKYGRTLVVDMADSATDFTHKFTSEDAFPAIEVLSECGRRMTKEANWAKVVRDADRENGVFVVREGFKVVVTSVFLIADYDEFLRSAIPMDEMIPIHIQPAQGDADS